MLYVPQIHTSINEGKDNCCVDDWLLTISLNSPVFLSSTAGVLESQDALASWVLAAHLRPDFSMENLLIKQGTVLGSYFLYRFWDSAFALSPSYTSTPSFVFTGWRAVSIFKFSLQPEVSTCWTLLMAWLWEFAWEVAIMTWLFCKLPQVDQAETAKCRELRLSKSWEHLGTVVARFVACGMICLRRLWYLIHGVKAVWDVIVWFLFDSRGRFPIHVGWFLNHPFLDSEASLVSQRRSRAALVFAKCIHVLLLHFLREWHYADHPGARCLGSLTQIMLTFLDIYNPETVWVTGAHPVKWQRPGSWEAQEIGGQLLKMGEGWHFLIRSSVAALAFWLRGYHTDSKPVGF